MSRPHFAYPTPDGFVDERAEFPFDKRQAAPPNGLISAAFPLLNQVLRLDNDADFYWRGFVWEFPDPTGFLVGQIAIRLHDSFGNYLSNDFIPIWNYGQGYYVMQPWVCTPPGEPMLAAPFCGGMGVAFADEIFCPASSVLQVDILGLNLEICNNIGRFLARGVKRRPAGECNA